MRAYIDADVLIWHLRGETKARDLLRRLYGSQEYELWTGAMQRAEVVFFMRPSEAEATRLLLSMLKTAPVDQVIVDNAAAIYQSWHASHGVDVNDALLAATIMLTGGKLYSLNDKHFPMPDLVVERPW